MLLLSSLYPSFGATCALRLGTQSWAQVLCAALHPPTLLTASAQCSGAGGMGQPSPGMARVSKSIPPGSCSSCSGCISHPSYSCCRLSPLESINREGRGTGLAAWHQGAGDTTEPLIGSILALSFAMQATSPQCLWGPVRCKGEGPPSSSDMTNLTRPFLLPFRPRPSGYGSVGR